MSQTDEITLPRALGEGLLLRRATPADAQAVADFNSIVHRHIGKEEPEEGELAWTLDLFEGRNPGVRPQDYLLVQDTAGGRIVSLTNLMDMVWSIGGIRFHMGRPESVGTLPEYRNRGLVRAQFQVLHAWSEARGDLAQGITGIPYYYRQFGYEMAIDLAGGRVGGPADVPRLREGETEPFSFRSLSEADLPFVMQLEEAAERRWLVASVNDEAHWRYELFGKREKNDTRLEWRILEAPAGEAAGIIGYSPKLYSDGCIAMPVCELRESQSWLAAVPAILRYLLAEGQRYAEREGRPFTGTYAQMSAQHPFCEATHLRLARTRRPYAWYVRVPDLARFLRHIAPALEARLACSAGVAYTGELKISLYRQGIRLTLDGGHLAGIAAWRPRHEDQGDVQLPGLTFLQLLFGWRDLDELFLQYPDCIVESDEARVLMRGLFPKGPSQMLWPAV